LIVNKNIFQKFIGTINWTLSLLILFNYWNRRCCSSGGIAVHIQHVVPANPPKP